MKAEFITPQCCKNPDIVVMDHKWPPFEEYPEMKVNRMCLKCSTHWAGMVGEVRQYTGKEWDAEVEKNAFYND